MNLHSDDPTCSIACRFSARLRERGFFPLPTGPTHREGHSLDQLWSRGLNLNLIEVVPVHWSDHHLVLASLDHWLPRTSNRAPLMQGKHWVHNFRQLSSEAFAQWQDTFPMVVDETRPDLLSTAIISQWSFIIEGLCPRRLVQTKSDIHFNNKWFNKELSDLKVMARRLERKWRKSSSFEDKQICRQHQQFYRAKIHQAKGAYLARSLPTVQSNSRTLFKITQEFLTPLSRVNNITPSESLCEDLAEFFTRKVTDIRSDILTSNGGSVPPGADAWPASDEAEPPSPLFTSFSPITLEQTWQALCRLGPSSSRRDPIPTRHLKNLSPAVAPQVRKVINASLSAGLVPDEWKFGLITPLLKKPSLDPTVLKNFRPVTQLPLFARLTEAIAVQQLQEHCEGSGVFHDRQSGFRPMRGTESALIDIRESLLEIADQSHPAVLILLDLSAAFDTIDHGILLQRLQSVARVGGTALAWCRSFLENRVQQVRLHDFQARPRPAPFGVPQGSALSPLLFNIYMQPLAQLLGDLGLRFQMYADDTQLLADLHESSQDGGRLLEGLRLIRRWMGDSWLCLNAAKTEIIIQGRWARPSAGLPFWPSEMGPPPEPVGSARNLGVIFSKEGKGDAQVSAVVGASHFKLNGLSRLMPLLSRPHRALLCQALVISKIRYCSGVYVGLTKGSLARLQKVQNRAVRLCCDLRRSDRVSGARRELGWLSISDLVEMQALCVIWRALHELGPRYLRARFHWAVHVHSPRPHNRARIHTTRPRLSRKGGSSLACWGPKWWNALPVTIRLLPTFCTFKRALKFHLRARDLIGT